MKICVKQAYMYINSRWDNDRHEGKLTFREQDSVFILFINRKFLWLFFFGGGGDRNLKLHAKDGSFLQGRNRILEEKMRPRIWLIKFIRLPHTQTHSK